MPTEGDELSRCGVEEFKCERVAAREDIETTRAVRCGTPPEEQHFRRDMQRGACNRLKNV